MNLPKMIIFDYGHTLLYEPDWNTDRGNAALLKYAVKNPNNCKVEDITKGAELIFGEHVARVRRVGYDISAQVANRTLYDYLGLEFSLTPVEMETVFWDNASAGAIMPNADKLIDYLNKNGIRTAVISNLLWSGTALANRLNRLLPNNEFEFVITSSDYFICKPNRILFEIALNKAGLLAKDVWYCGDNPQNDIEGAARVGIFPIWYDSPIDKDYIDRTNEKQPQCEHLYINQWDEMIKFIEGLKK